MNRDELMESLAAWEKRLGQEQAIITRHVKARARVKALIARRKAQIKALPKPLSKGQKAVAAAMKDAAAGVHEIPNGSNWGGKVAEYLKYSGLGAAPWCGAAVRYWLNVGGGFAVSGRTVYVPSIIADAKVAQNGWKLWLDPARAKDAPIGAAVIMDFGSSRDVGEHVGLLRERYVGGGTVKTVEGNTSPGASGSQDNGQGVYARERSLGVVIGFAVPA